MKKVMFDEFLAWFFWLALAAALLRFATHGRAIEEIIMRILKG